MPAVYGWHEEAADHGTTQAWFNAGERHGPGGGIEQDGVYAARRLKKGCGLGLAGLLQSGRPACAVARGRPGRATARVTGQAKSLDLHGGVDSKSAASPKRVTRRQQKSGP